MQSIQYASLSDVGFRRANNQDCCAVLLCPDSETWATRGHLLMVADGMGGHAVGELASKIAADTVPHTFFKLKQLSMTEALETAIKAANGAIHERGNQNRDFERMGTTCTALVLSPHGAVVGHVGDTRAYRIRDGRIDQLTFDHSLQWELLRQGGGNPDEVFLREPRNVITRSLGPEPAVKVDVEGPYPIRQGDTYVLCSDGLTTHVSDSEIGMIGQELPPADACRLLVNLANLRGGLDNISVVIARAGQPANGVVAAVAPVTSESPVENAGPEWRKLAVFIGTATAIVCSLVLVLSGKMWVGLIVGAFAMMIGIILLRDDRSNQKRRLKIQTQDDTVLMKAYRTASAQLDPQFLSQVAAIEFGLQQTAVDEGWSIDWPQHEERYQKAKAAVVDRRYPDALREYGCVIDVLMTGLQRHRKQVAQASKWGKPKSGVQIREVPP